MTNKIKLINTEYIINVFNDILKDRNNNSFSYISVNDNDSDIDASIFLNEDGIVRIRYAINNKNNIEVDYCAADNELLKLLIRYILFSKDAEFEYKNGCAIKTLSSETIFKKTK